MYSSAWDLIASYLSLKIKVRDLSCSCFMGLWGHFESFITSGRVDCDRMLEQKTIAAGSLREGFIRAGECSKHSPKLTNELFPSKSTALFLLPQWLWTLPFQHELFTAHQQQWKAFVTCIWLLQFGNICGNWCIVLPCWTSRLKEGQISPMKSRTDSQQGILLCNCGWKHKTLEIRFVQIVICQVLRKLLFV